MSKFKLAVLAAFALSLGAVAAIAGGIFTNGLPAVSTTCTATNGSCNAWPLTGSETLGVDTNLGSGAPPQSESMTTQQLATFANGGVQQTLTDAATITPDVSTGSVFTVTLGGNRTLANPTNLVAGRRWEVYVKQDSTGTRTLSYGNKYFWSGGAAQATPTLSTTPAFVDKLTFYYDGLSILGSATNGY